MSEEFSPSKIEAFHLICLSQLMPRIGANQLAVKGGVAMRLFYNSPRYSNDIDFNVSSTLSKERLSHIVDGVLANKGSKALLQQQRTEITFLSAPKQTQTTQRWKVHLSGLEYQGRDIPTKLEFSRRGMDGRLVNGIVKEEVTTKYGLPSFSVTRYPLETMIDQKIKALAYRKEPKARDAFDLSWLMINKNWASNLRVEDEKTLTLAFEQLAALTYDDYEQQVIPFLDQDFMTIFKSKNAWSGIVNNTSKIIDKLVSLPTKSLPGAIL